MEDLGKVLLIVNPTSQSGRGREAAVEAENALRPTLGDKLEIVFTEAEKHATKLAAAAAQYDTVIALGGDGVIHETVNGLMQIDQSQRPRFGILPIGSGNDYARSLNVSRSNIPASAAELLAGTEHAVDVGCCNGEYFVETLSFGLDAAIAIETMELRKTTNKTETALYFDAGINQILHHFDFFTVDILIDGEQKMSVEELTFAVQIGQTYGGGFQICPDAKLDDGIFDICYSETPISVPKALFMFSKAKTGKHLGFKQVKTFKAHSLDLKFNKRPPCQMDGEIHLADEYHITMCPQALRVIWNR